MGEREFGTRLYYQLSLDVLVLRPQDHLLRRVARAVDFAFVRRLCRPVIGALQPYRPAIGRPPGQNRTHVLR